MDIKAWYQHELQNPRRLHGQPRLVMGCPIWGDFTYCSWFHEYGLPSILARPNRKALDVAGWQLILYVEDPMQTRRDIARTFDADVPVETRPLPEGFVKAFQKDGALKFPMLAAVHNLLIHEAGRYADAGFHMLLPDHVYSENYFANLLWLAYKHPAIVQTSLTSTTSEIKPLLEPFRQRDNSIGIAAPLLGSIGWQTMTPQWKSWCLDGNETFEQMPNTDFIFWRGRDGIRMHCAHQNLMWLSPNRCRLAPREFGGTMDSELPLYTRMSCVTPQLDDDMAFIALSGGGAPAPIVDFAKFRTDFWANLGGNKAFEKYVRTPCFLPCKPADGFPDAKELDLRFQHVMRKLEENPDLVTAT